MKMFNIPNLITASNMLCGVFAIILAFAGRIDIAPYFIFLAAVLDFFDGFAARMLKQQGELGKQLDSLADMISFGLAPGVIMMIMLIFSTTPVGIEDMIWHGEYVNAVMKMEGVFHPTFQTALAIDMWKSHFFDLKSLNWLPFLGLIIPFFSLFRLAKFNIDTRQSESFIGLPTPANTIFFMAFPLLLSQYGGTTGWEHDLILWLIQPIVLIPIIVIMSVLLVSELPLFALKFKHFKWKGNGTRYVFLISCGILISTLLIWSIPIIVLLYLLLSFIQHILRKNRTHEIQS
nr:CDP-alcohol phosphatidyltransferase family protein [uncultured Fluviicola sp.]